MNHERSRDNKKRELSPAAHKLIAYLALGSLASTGALVYKDLKDDLGLERLIEAHNGQTQLEQETEKIITTYLDDKVKINCDAKEALDKRGKVSKPGTKTLGFVAPITIRGISYTPRVMTLQDHVCDEISKNTTNNEVTAEAAMMLIVAGHEYEHIIHPDLDEAGADCRSVALAPFRLQNIANITLAESTDLSSYSARDLYRSAPDEYKNDQECIHNGVYTQDIENLYGNLPYYFNESSLRNYQTQMTESTND